MLTSQDYFYAIIKLIHGFADYFADWHFNYIINF